MFGGKVSGNTADKGGGIYGYYSHPDMGVIKISGGEVSGNTATSDDYAGGGIYSKYQLTVSGSAQIKSNTAPNGSGGGIAIPHGGTFDFTGGTVSGNTADEGGGIYISTTAAGTVPIKISGNATVTEDNDVFLDNGSGDDTYIIVTGELKKPHAARLTMKDAPGYTSGYAVDRVVVKGDGYPLTAADIEKFPITSQEISSGLYILWTTELDGNELKLKKITP